MTKDIHTSRINREGGYVYETIVFADGYVLTSLYNATGFEVYAVERYMRGTEKSADVICANIDDIEGYYFQ